MRRYTQPLREVVTPLADTLTDVMLGAAILGLALDGVSEPRAWPAAVMLGLVVTLVSRLELRRDPPARVASMPHPVLVLNRRVGGEP